MPEVRAKTTRSRTRMGDPVAVIPSTAHFVPSTTHAFVPKERPTTTHVLDAAATPVHEHGIPQAHAALVEGEANAWAKMAIGTVGRAGLIGVGCYLVGVRGVKPLVLGSLASSATISLLLTVHHAYRTRRHW